MRKSDTIKNGKFIDKEISSDLHDKIMVKLYTKLKNDSEFAKKFAPKNCVFNNTRIEYALTALKNYNKILGYVDVAAFYKRPFGDDSDETVYVFFEVKTKINVGELLRQITYYLYNSPGDSTFYVCAPKCEPHIIEILKEHRVGFVSSEDL